MKEVDQRATGGETRTLCEVQRRGQVRELLIVQHLGQESDLHTEEDEAENNLLGCARWIFFFG